MQDPHDPRNFRQWCRFGADGTIASVHEHAPHIEQPHPELVETTHLFPFDTTTVTVDPALVQALKTAHGDLQAQRDALELAAEKAKQAHVNLKVAVTNAGLQQKASAAPPPEPGAML